MAKINMIKGFKLYGPNMKKMYINVYRSLLTNIVDKSTIQTWKWYWDVLENSIKIHSLSPDLSKPLEDFLNKSLPFKLNMSSKSSWFLDLYVNHVQPFAFFLGQTQEPLLSELLSNQLACCYDGLSTLRYYKFDLPEITALIQNAKTILTQLESNFRERSLSQLMINTDQMNTDDYLYENMLNSARWLIKQT